MVKIQNISGIHSTLGFPEFDILENYRKSFHESELGRLHSLFPFDYMTKSAGLSDRHLGRRFSDQQLVEYLNGKIPNTLKTSFHSRTIKLLKIAVYLVISEIEKNGINPYGTGD